MSTSHPTIPPRPGLPDPSTVVKEFTLQPPVAEAAEFGAAPRAVYRVLRTTQRDPYDREPEVSLPETAFADGELDTMVLERVSGDHFAGTARKAAKISISPAATEQFDDLTSLIACLPPDEEMIDHDPRIGRHARSNRVSKEHRNVRVTTFLYAASRENDNDFHMIMGTDPDRPPLVCLNVELSGLPSESSDHFARLSDARDAYKALMAMTPFGLPGFDYDFYDPPLPVEIEGSLFFDISHATGSRPGPQSLRPFISTIWEIHPISAFVPRL